LSGGGIAHQAKVSKRLGDLNDERNS